jgi:hypothetical protein
MNSKRRVPLQSAIHGTIIAALAWGTLAGAGTAFGADEPTKGSAKASTTHLVDSGDLALQIERVRARGEIENLMGRYSFNHTAGMHAQCVDLFAMKTPGLHVEMVWGVYNGPEGIRKLYPGFHAWSDGNGIGKMFIHTMTTPVIEVAGDGMTAKGVWVSPGSETMQPGNDLTLEPKGRWSWIKYGADFIKEEGQWKIWHMHVYGLFSSDPDKSWVDEKFNAEQVQGYRNKLPKEFQPDAPPTTRLWKYQKDVKPELVPVPPKPYLHFDPATAY